jgi:hypothetical protein
LDCGMDVDQFNSWHWNFLLVLKILADDKGWVVGVDSVAFSSLLGWHYRPVDWWN